MRLTLHVLYLALQRGQAARQAACRALFRSELDEKAIAGIRLTLQQCQPLGSERFQEKISVVTGMRRVRPLRGRPRQAREVMPIAVQTEFGF